MHRALLLVSLAACSESPRLDMNVIVTLGDAPETSALTAEISAFTCEDSRHEDNDVDCDDVPGLRFAIGTIGNPDVTFADHRDGTYSAELAGYHDMLEVLYDGDSAVTRHHYEVPRYFTGAVTDEGGGLWRASWTQDDARLGECMEVQLLGAGETNLGGVTVPECDADSVVFPPYQGTTVVRLQRTSLDFGENIEDANGRYVQGWFEVRRDIVLP